LDGPVVRPVEVLVEVLVAVVAAVELDEVAVVV